MIDLAGIDERLAEVADDLTILRGDAGVWWMGGMAKEAGMEIAVRDLYRNLDRALANVNAARNRLEWAEMGKGKGDG